MRVVSVWRYPVKSMQGEPLETADVSELGIAGDRQWALVDTSTGLALTARRVPELLFATPRLVDADHVEVELPDGTVTADDGPCRTGWTARCTSPAPPGARRAIRDRRRLRGRGGVGVVPVGRSGGHVPRLRPDPGVGAGDGIDRRLGPAAVPRQRHRRRRGRGRRERARRSAHPDRFGDARRDQADRSLRDDHPPATRRHRARPRRAADDQRRAPDLARRRHARGDTGPAAASATRSSSADPDGPVSDAPRSRSAGGRLRRTSDAAQAAHGVRRR